MTAAAVKPREPASLAEVAGHLVALAESDARAPRRPWRGLDLPTLEATDAEILAWLEQVEPLRVDELPARATWAALARVVGRLPDAVLWEIWAALDVHLAVIGPPAKERWWLVGRVLRDACHLAPAVRAWLVEAAQGGTDA